jgi:hypothetical protein
MRTGININININRRLGRPTFSAAARMTYGTNGYLRHHIK